MKFEMTRVLHEDKIIFSGEVTGYDLMTLNLDSFDRRLLEECEVSTSPADKLLALEMLFRRHAEARVQRKPDPNDKSYMHRQGDPHPRLGDDDA